MAISKTPTAVLYTQTIDIELIVALSRHWVVITQEQETNIKLELYLKQ